MKIINCLNEKVKLKQHCIVNNYKKIAIRFLHGLGDVAMFRSILRQLRKELPNVTIHFYSNDGKHELAIPDAFPWKQNYEEITEKYDAFYELMFPPSEWDGHRSKPLMKCHKSALVEVGIDYIPSEIDSIPTNLFQTKIAGFHFHSTSCDVNNPPEWICKMLWDRAQELGFVTLEINFSPINPLYGFVKNHVRGQPHSVNKLISLISVCSVVVSVNSGPMLVTLATYPEKLIYLQRDIGLEYYTKKKIKTLNSNSLDMKLYEKFLNETVKCDKFVGIGI